LSEIISSLIKVESSIDALSLSNILKGNEDIIVVSWILALIGILDKVMESLCCSDSLYLVVAGGLNFLEYFLKNLNKLLNDLDSGNAVVKQVLWILRVNVY